jgi:uncharacterized protein YjiS (DUF1127 family)
MLLKLNIAVAKQHTPINHVWSTVVAFLRARRQHARDRRAISRMDDHMLRDIGLTHSVYNSRDRARYRGR